MDKKRIREIQQKTAYPDSGSVNQALNQVWHECGIEKAALIADLESALQKAYIEDNHLAIDVFYDMLEKHKRGE